MKMNRKSTYGVYWLDKHIPLVSFKAKNRLEAEKIAKATVTKWEYEGTFKLEKLDGNRFKEPYYLYIGEYKAEDYEQDPWYISSIRRKIK